MDPISHAVFGAAAAHAVLHKPLGRTAILFGAAGALLPDIDVFWGFLADPALPWELHRHFTHALVFIPFGGLIAAAPLMLFKPLRKHPVLGWLAASIGCATHGINDTFTSFGTFLYWPFSQQRAAWDVISIIDPLFTIPLLLGVILALIVNRSWLTRAAFAWSLLYVALGFVQNQRVLHVQQQLAEHRGHDIQRSRAMPTFGNIIIWRSLYEDADGVMHADAVRPGLFSQTLVQPGQSLQRITRSDLPDDGHLGQRLDDVFPKFAAFADGYVGYVDGNTNALGDMRYSTDTPGFSPMWGLALDVHDTEDPLRWVGFTRDDDGDSRADALARLWNDLRSPGQHWQPLDQLLE